MYNLLLSKDIISTYLTCITLIFQCVCFHPNGNYIASGSSEYSCRLWDIQSGQFVRVFAGHKVSWSEKESQEITIGGYIKKSMLQECNFRSSAIGNLPLQVKKYFIYILSIFCLIIMYYCFIAVFHEERIHGGTLPFFLVSAFFFELEIFWYLIKII